MGAFPPQTILHAYCGSVSAANGFQWHGSVSAANGFYFMAWERFRRKRLSMAWKRFRRKRLNNLSFPFLFLFFFFVFLFFSFSFPFLFFSFCCFYLLSFFVSLLFVSSLLLHIVDKKKLAFVAVVALLQITIITNFPLHFDCSSKCFVANIPLYMR